MFFCRLYSWSVYVKNEENRHRTLILSIQVRSFFNEFFCTLFFLPIKSIFSTFPSHRQNVICLPVLSLVLY